MIGSDFEDIPYHVLIFSGIAGHETDRIVDNTNENISKQENLKSFGFPYREWYE